ncbi:hypothetical protein C1H46_045917 [Malus baccata]|uniref:Uncharacterized protein n=1 Tax=Malus baccata TaxID=106549 RepID=A0A540K2N8_MALBA|nr:hypothetical protein C1H46_045917 [Malus baccata]
MEIPDVPFPPSFRLILHDAKLPSLHCEDFICLEQRSMKQGFNIPTKTNGCIPTLLTADFYYFSVCKLRQASYYHDGLPIKPFK